MPWIPIRYRDFHDVPRAFVIEHEEGLLFFDSPFDERRDEYPDHYRVYRLARELSVVLDAGSWEGLARRGEFIAEVPVHAVRFDDTLRAAVEDSVLKMIKERH